MIKDEDYILRHTKGNTIFEGCQCYKDCTCHEDFVPESFEYWNVKNLKSKKMKVSRYSTLEQAKARIEQIKQLPKTI